MKNYEKHGYKNHPLYGVWSMMKARCSNPKFRQYADYGGRGIAVCAEWKASAKSFVEWCVENGWKPGLTIDRRDNDAGYSPDNCQFLTRKEQNQNRRRMSHFTKKSKLPMGVCARPGGWFQALIFIAGHQKSLGYFRTPEKASDAYQIARGPLTS